MKLLEVTEGGQAWMHEKRRPRMLAKNGVRRNPASQYKVSPTVREIVANSISCDTIG
jgi:hypothetical protein